MLIREKAVRELEETVVDKSTIYHELLSYLYFNIISFRQQDSIDTYRWSGVVLRQRKMQGELNSSCPALVHSG
jgi:hypothetical protein